MHNVEKTSNVEGDLNELFRQNEATHLLFHGRPKQHFTAVEDARTRTAEVMLTDSEIAYAVRDVTLDRTNLRLDLLNEVPHDPQALETETATAFLVDLGFAVTPYIVLDTQAPTTYLDRLSLQNQEIMAIRTTKRDTLGHYLELPQVAVIHAWPGLPAEKLEWTFVHEQVHGAGFEHIYYDDDAYEVDKGISRITQPATKSDFFEESLATLIASMYIKINTPRQRRLPDMHAQLKDGGEVSWHAYAFGSRSLEMLIYRDPQLFDMLLAAHTEENAELNKELAARVDAVSPDITFTELQQASPHQTTPFRLVLNGASRQDYQQAHQKVCQLFAEKLNIDI